MKRLLAIVISGAALLLAIRATNVVQPRPTTGRATDAIPERTSLTLSEVYEVDRIYPSMKGPSGVQEVRLLDVATRESDELLWITGFRAEMVGEDGATPMPAQFMCHSNLDFDTRYHNHLLGHTKPLDGRLFTLSQGQLALHFPAGFGIPVFASEPLALTTQVLNMNVPDARFRVRHKILLDFVRDRDLKQPLRALYEAGVYGLVSLSDHAAYYDEVDPSAPQKQSLCLPGRDASTHPESDSFDQQFAGHWVIPPGREIRKTGVTRLLNLPFDTTVHYIAVHLHPFAESLELRDVTTGKSIFRSRARNRRGAIGLDHVDSFSSSEGVPLFADHDYELTSVYNNTTDQDQDSMAVMYLYLFDREFRRPER